MSQQTEDYPDFMPADANTVQQAMFTLLYYVCAFEPTIFVALNSIAGEQTHNTKASTKKVVQLLNYAAPHPKAITRCFASGMTLHMHSYS